MPIPVTICDDSSFARKQIARALPKGWDVSITYAANGLEGLEAIRAGQGEILFLDLTMPELDGFGVLEHVLKEGLNTLPIVVSGDIQPESEKRVKQLGAVAFIKKPVKAEELVAVLQDYGVLEILDGEQPPEEDVEVGFSEWCQEVANVAMGRAADLLAKAIGQEIALSIPNVQLMAMDDLGMVMSVCDGSKDTLVIQGFNGAGIAGETLMFVDTQDQGRLASILGHHERTLIGSEREWAMDIANVLVGAFMKGLAELLDVSFSQGHPRIFLPEEHSRPMVSCHEGETILAIDIRYTIGDDALECDQLLLFTHNSIQPLTQRAEFALGV